MTKGNSSKQSEHHLKQLIETAVEDLCQLTSRGLKFTINNLEATGQPLHRISAAATLFFLPKGSPFCCDDPDCHMEIRHLDGRERLNLRIANDLHLTQDIDVRVELITSVKIGDTQFDPWYHAPGVPMTDIDVQDGLGRTALIRAAQRGHIDLFEKLVEAGAKLAIRDDQGKTALDYVGENHWLQKLYRAGQ